MTPAFSEALHTLQPQRNGGGFMARCPAHEDRVRSLSIREIAGKTLLKCHAGCPTPDIIAAMGLSMSDLFDDTAATWDRPEAHVREAVYDYRDETGAVLYHAVRYRPKSFSLELPDGTRSLNGVRRVPYRLPELLASDKTVLIVEGEKDADRLASLGFIATTNAAGAGKWDPAWGDFLQGRIVRILPDNDEPGLAAARSIAESLAGIADVKVVELPDLPPKGDVSDWLNAGHTADELKEVLKRKPDLRRKLDYERMADIEITESPGLVLDPFILSEGPAIMFGDGGSGKSTLALCLAATLAMGHEYVEGVTWSETGPVLWIDYESQRLTTRKRAKLLGVADADIIYVPGRKPLVQDVDRLKRIAEAEGAQTAIVDSIVLSTGGASPNDAESATQWATAINTIVPRSLALAHVTKNADNAGRYPYGSIFWHNVARLTWYVKRDFESADHIVQLYCRKRNDGTPFRERTYRLDWSDGRLRVLAMDGGSMIERIVATLRAGPLTIHDLATQLDLADLDQLRRWLTGDSRTAYLPGIGPGEPGRWKLATQY